MAGNQSEEEGWAGKHVYRVNNRESFFDEDPSELEQLAKLRSVIEPWVTSLVSSEHLALLVGSGLSTAVAHLVGQPPLEMTPTTFTANYSSEVDERARAVAKAAGRGSANIEDQIRAALELIGGLTIIGDPAGSDWEAELQTLLNGFAAQLLAVEAALSASVHQATSSSLNCADVLASFFGAFVARSAVKDRLHIFTTNYDRIIEFSLDEAAIWQLDRFVGQVSPRFRSSRLDLDIHYNPPGIRGEPRYLEGVARVTKLHGSIDWIARGLDVSRAAIPFGCTPDLYQQLMAGHESLLIYPNPAKDVETSEYPYAELFRDFSAAIVRPETVLVTYGYGFGDDHINRVIRDMLTIPSTHLLVIAYGDPDLRIRNFLKKAGSESRVSLLLGPHFGDLEILTHRYLPKPSIDRVSHREAELLQRRGFLPSDSENEVDASLTDFDADGPDAE